MFDLKGASAEIETQAVNYAKKLSKRVYRDAYAKAKKTGAHRHTANYKPGIFMPERTHRFWESVAENLEAELAADPQFLRVFIVHAPHVERGTIFVEVAW